MRLKLSAAVLVLSLLLVSCGDPATSASGEVVDESGKPIEGVVVVMESEIAGGFRKESEQETGKDGKFNFVTITGSANLVRLRFSKEGFQEFTQVIPELERSDHKITLKRE